MFPAATMGRVLVRAEDRIGLFELSSHRLIAELTSVNVKYVVWSADGSHVALLGKHSMSPPLPRRCSFCLRQLTRTIAHTPLCVLAAGVVLADRDLTQICSVNETVRVKSGCWDEHGVFIYTTLNHIKYLLPLPSGEHGIVRTLDNPVYTVECRYVPPARINRHARVHRNAAILCTRLHAWGACACSGNNLFVLDRDAKMKPIAVDTTEYQFKLALARHQPEKVIGIIKTSQLCGHAVIAYLQKAGTWLPSPLRLCAPSFTARHCVPVAHT
ncbi:hypothetical protein EON66_01300 [archaeon]|nr:MAG: hypothetical protein EON66_01300 [archaeon]